MRSRKRVRALRGGLRLIQYQDMPIAVFETLGVQGSGFTTAMRNGRHSPARSTLRHGLRVAASVRHVTRYKALHKSPMAMDAYTSLAFRMGRSGSYVELNREALHRHLGQEHLWLSNLKQKTIYNWIREDCRAGSMPQPTGAVTSSSQKAQQLSML